MYYLGSVPGCNDLGQVVHTYVPLSPSSITSKGHWCSAAGKVTAGLAKSNGSLPPSGWLIVTCGLTACTPGSGLDPTLSNEYVKRLPFTRLQCFCCHMPDHYILHQLSFIFLLWHDRPVTLKLSEPSVLIDCICCLCCHWLIQRFLAVMISQVPCVVEWRRCLFSFQI